MIEIEPPEEVEEKPARIETSLPEVASFELPTEIVISPTSSDEDDEEISTDPDVDDVASLLMRVSVPDSDDEESLVCTETLPEKLDDDSPLCILTEPPVCEEDPELILRMFPEEEEEVPTMKFVFPLCKDDDVEIVMLPEFSEFESPVSVKFENGWMCVVCEKEREGDRRRRRRRKQRRGSTYAW